MDETADLFGRAITAAEDVYLREVWPRREHIVADALRMLRERLVSTWVEMTAQQGQLLGLTWPDRIDAFLVPDCYERRGAYSHPFTVDASAASLLELCETMLHEATHVADVHTGTEGRGCLGDRLIDRLGEGGVARADAWNVWHAVIFAASARQVRESLDPAHGDYATGRGIYDFFRVSDMPAIWDRYAAGSLDEDAFTTVVSQRLTEVGVVRR